MNYIKGQKYLQSYRCEPAFIYGGGIQKEECVVIGEPFEWEGNIWVPVKGSLPHPTLVIAKHLEPA